MIFDMLIVIFLIGCLVYGIKETMEHWDNEQD